MMQWLTMIFAMVMAMPCCAVVVDIRTVGEFAAAWEQAKTVDTEIVVRESLDFAGRTFAVGSRVEDHAPTTITIRGARPGITLTANCWTGDPAIPPKSSAFIYFNHDRVTLSNVEIRNFDTLGTAVRFSNAQQASIVGCRFSRIGINAYAPVNRQVENYPYNGRGFIGAGCIGGWGGNKSVLVADCMFKDCCYGNEYAHLVYVRADDVEIRNCLAEYCGQPFQCSGKRIRYVNNVIRDPAPTNQRWQQIHYPFVFYMDADELVITGNRLEGTFSGIYYGTIKGKAVIDHNDYSRVRLGVPLKQTTYWAAGGGKVTRLKEWPHDKASSRPSSD